MRKQFSTHNRQSTVETTCTRPGQAHVRKNFSMDEELFIKYQPKLRGYLQLLTAGVEESILYKVIIPGGGTMLQ